MSFSLVVWFCCCHIVVYLIFIVKLRSPVLLELTRACWIRHSNEKSETYNGKTEIVTYVIGLSLKLALCFNFREISRYETNLPVSIVFLVANVVRYIIYEAVTDKWIITDFYCLFLCCIVNLLSQVVKSGLAPSN